MEAAVNVTKAIDTNDKTLFLSNIHCTDAELGDALFATQVATRDLTRAFEREYSRDKWGLFRGYRLPGPAEVAETITFDVRGDRATGRVPDQEHPTLLVRRDGGWREDVEAEVSAQGSTAEREKMQAGRYVRSVRKALGKAGIGVYKDRPELMLDELIQDVSGKNELGMPWAEEPRKEEEK